MKSRWTLLAGIYLAFILNACATPRTEAPVPVAVAVLDIHEIQWQIEQLLSGGPPTVPVGDPGTQGILREVYAARAYEPLWTRPGKVAELVALLRDAVTYGLDPADYNLTQIESRLAAGVPGTPRAAAELDLLLSEGLLRYGYHRRYGKVRAQDLDSNFNFRREAFLKKPPAQMVREASESESLESFIQGVVSTGPLERTFRDYLRRYRDIAATGGWRQISPGPTLHPGDQDPRVAALRQRLYLTGDLAEPNQDPDAPYDDALQVAVQHFQSRHALNPDGLVGKETLVALNEPVETRIDQLRLSLERLRWVSEDAPHEFVAINIAGYELFYFHDREIAWTTRVMVGKSFRQTPVFRGDITYLEMNPTWTIPPTILRNDTLPAIRKNPNYLSEKNISVLDREGHRVDPASIDWSTAGRGFPYTLRQEAGPDNALGRIKFIFPNSHFVFLHDTPNRALFNQPERAFSSGCIRVEHPLELARLILEGRSKADITDIQRMIDSGRTERVVLQETMPVLVLYFTASLDIDGNVRFFRDIYQRDVAVLAALNAPVTAEAIL